MTTLGSNLIIGGGGGGGGASDHGALTGLTDDDHTLYQKESEKDQDSGYVGRDANGLVTASGGGVQFPATQIASADPNAQDDYEEGTWTPVLTFATPGDLSVAYIFQEGTYTKKGREVTVHFVIITSTFTHTTASGGLRITGLPFTAGTGVTGWAGSCQVQGITKAGYTQFTPEASSSGTFITVRGSGSGQSLSSVVTADMPTAGTVILRGVIVYNV